MYVTKAPLIQSFNTYILLFQGKSKQYCITILYSLSSAQQDYISCCLCLRAVLNWSGVSDSTINQLLTERMSEDGYSYESWVKQICVASLWGFSVGEYQCQHDCSRLGKTQLVSGLCPSAEEMATPDHIYYFGKTTFLSIHNYHVHGIDRQICTIMVYKL